MRVTLGPATRRWLTVGFAAATLLLGSWLWFRTRATPPAETAAAPASPEPAEVADEPAAEPEPEPALPSDCDALARRAVDHDADATLLAWLCPSHPLDPVTARALLLSVRSADEAAAVAPRLADFPSLQGLAQLVAQTRAPPVPGLLPNPNRAVVNPVDARVLARVQQAQALITEPGLPLAERTRARAYVAKVYLQATQQLGVTVGRPPGPFARLLTGRALYYGRSFTLSYWRNRVAGLARLFAEIETRLLELCLALEGGPWSGDGARLAVELERTRRYLQLEGPTARIERRLAERGTTPWSLERLLPPPNAIERLLGHGFVDLAIARALDEGRRADGPGLAPTEQLLRDTLARAEQGEYLALMERRFARVRARSSAPAEHAAGEMTHAAERAWPGASQVADEAAHWLVRAPARGFARHYALGRALLLVRDRPDALVQLLDRASDAAAPPSLAAAEPWLLEELDARDDGRRSWLRRRVAAESATTGPEALATMDAEETHRRRSFALRLREADRLPRGPGMLPRAG
ncbi:MAG: hypothetical protein AAF799_19740 [Myxococcota bacterium]